MSKSPDEIKKGLECCIKSACEPCCPYGNTANCKFAIHLLEDVLAYIRQLESDKQQLEGMLHHMNQLRDAAARRALQMEGHVHQLEVERDAAVRELADHCGCLVCQHADTDPDKAPCNECTNCNGDGVEFKWQWRGVQKEDSNA